MRIRARRACALGKDADRNANRTRALSLLQRTVVNRSTWSGLVEPVDHHDCRRRAVVAATATPAVVLSPRAPVIRATAKQVRYEL